MDIEKLVELLQNNRHPNGLKAQAASALSTLQAENEKLRDELEKVKEKNAGLALALLTECAPNPDCLDDDEWKAIRAELEMVKWERDAAVEQLHGVCSACKNYSPYHNRGKCRFCVYELARDKDAEVNDNWEWIGQRKED